MDNKIKNFGEDSLKVISFYISNELSKEDKKISKFQDNIVEILEELISRIIELIINHKENFELSSEKQKFFDNTINKSYTRIDDVKTEVDDLLKTTIKSNIYEIVDIFEAFKKSKVDEFETINFINDYISYFHIDDLILNKFLDSSFYEENLDIQIFLERLTIFPGPNTAMSGLNGNKIYGYLETDNFDFVGQDELIEKFLDLNIDNSSLSLMLLRYRVGSENWLYHCEIMNNYENILKGNGKPQKLDLLIDEKRINPVHYNYGLNLINQALQKKYFKKSIWYVFFLIIFPIFILFNSDNDTLKILSSIAICFAILREIYLKTKNLIRKFSKKENKTLSLRAEMMLLSYDLEGGNIGTFSSIDTEAILNKIRELRNKAVAYPPSLIHLLKKELDKGNYNLKINGTKNGTKIN